MGQKSRGWQPSPPPPRCGLGWRNRRCGRGLSNNNLHPTSTVFTDKLWLSDNAKFKKSIVIDWNDKGLRFVADLYCKQSGISYSTNDLNTIFNVKMTFLFHASLITNKSSVAGVGGAVQKTAFPILPYKISLMTRQAKYHA